MYFETSNTFQNIIYFGTNQVYFVFNFDCIPRDTQNSEDNNQYNKARNGKRLKLQPDLKH